MIYQKKYIYSLCILIICIAFFIFSIKRNAPLENTPYTTQQQTSTTTNQTLPENPKDSRISLGWRLKEKPDGAYDEPYSQVYLELSGSMNAQIDLGIFSGCRITDRTAYATDATIAELLCWWAGGGDYISVEQTNSTTLTVWDEPIGESPDGLPIKREVLKTISIPESSTVLSL
jgi:hypothetical protein